MFVCSTCSAQFPKWSGKCQSCGAWNTLEQMREIPASSKVNSGKGKVLPTHKISLESLKDTLALKSSSAELDSVLGEGLVPGSLVLLSGEPGIGKSTLALQMSEWYAQMGTVVLYISGEEHIGQISKRAQRLSVSHEDIALLSDADFENIFSTILSHPAQIIIIDSISVLSHSGIDGSPGSITQIRTMTEILMNLAKKTNKSILLIGHVTKDGSISGPKSLEHLVDVVLFLEGVRTENYRILRAFKNRFGSTDNVGLFRMEQIGLVDLPNPGMEFVEGMKENLNGSAFTFTIEGNRALLIEIEALTTYTKFGYPKRSSRGVSSGKLELLLAVMSKFTDIKLDSYDVYLNIARGIHVSEPGIDLACIAAIMSSRTNSPLQKTIYLGEVSLTGIVKNISHMEKRLFEADKLGFKNVVISSQYSGKIPLGMHITKVGHIHDMPFRESASRKHSSSEGETD